MTSNFFETSQQRVLYYNHTRILNVILLLYFVYVWFINTGISQWLTQQCVNYNLYFRKLTDSLSIFCQKTKSLSILFKYLVW